jgi:hypothetical protein
MSTAHLGHVVLPETRAKIGAGNANPSDETRARKKAAMMGNKNHLGQKESPETRAKIAIAHIGIRPSPETRAKESASHIGVKMSPETVAKRAASQWRGGPKVSSRKHNAKHRTLGFNALNSFFTGCEGHHINQSDVIYIPAAMHQSVRHNVWTGRNMEKINLLAGAYLTEDWT